MKENFKITGKEDGREYWISRAVAVAVVVYGFPGTESESGVFLIHKRGPGCPDNIGSWSTNCGYLGWGETVKEGAVRELFEETGLDIPADHLRFLSYSDPVGDGKENVTLQFIAPLPKSFLNHEIKVGKINKESRWRGGEEGEISEFRLIEASEAGISGVQGDWAFKHDELLRKALEYVKEVEA